MKNSLYDLRELDKRIRKLIGTKVLGKIQGITVEKTAEDNVLMLKPTAPDPVFVVSYINSIGDNITIPIEASSLHVSVQQGPYKKNSSEESINIEAYQD